MSTAPVTLAATGLVALAGGATTGNASGSALRFEFSLDRTRTTSAGLWSDDGRLLRTLWRGERLAAGTHSRQWDGLDDLGQPVLPAAVTVRVIHHDVRYEWDGVVGNTSSTAANIASASVHRSFMRPTSLAPAGGRMHFSVGYNEAQNGLQAFDLAFPQIARPRVNLVDPFIAAGLVATDGQRLYWTNIGGLSKRSFVAAFDLSTSTPWRFSFGVSQCLSFQADGRTCWAPQWYPSVLEPRADLSSPPTGLAVQANGRLLAVAYAREGRVRLFDKVSGETLGDIAAGRSADAENQLAFAADGALWILERDRALRVAVPADGALAVTAITGLVRPLAMVIDPADVSRIWIAEGGERQQVRRYDAQGRWVESVGVSGALAADPTAGRDRLSFAAEFGRERSALAVDERGSLWIADTGNNRLLERLADGRAGATVAWLPAVYVTAVDPRSPRRVFANFLEFEVDDVPGRTAADSWRLVRNWLPSLPASLRDDRSANWGWGGFHTVHTLPDGRTFAQLTVSGRHELVELPREGPARRVSTWPVLGPLETPPVLTLAGDITTARSDAQRQTVLRYRLEGYDANGDPRWGALPSVLASAANSADSAWFRPGTFSGAAGPSFPQTADGRVLSFHPGVQADSRFHLGAISGGPSGVWSFRGAPSGPLDGRGAVQTQRHDPGLQYGGNAIRLQGRNVILGYHGEFYTDLGNRRMGQANQFLHYRDDGLFIGQFGTPSTRASGPTAPGLSGNAFSPWLVDGPSGPVLYHNDESTHGGVHRWRVLGMDDLVELSARVPAPAAISEPARLN